MWHKHYKIAERQIISGKLKTFEGHALKALESARAAKDAKGIAATLALLGSFYLDQEHPDTESTLRESANAAELAYGPDSREFGDALCNYAGWLQRNEHPDDFEATQLKALAIFARCEDQMLFLEAADILIEFYLENERYTDAESWFLQALEVRKTLFGATSQQVENEIQFYADILEGLGRSDELAELDLGSRYCACGPGSPHRHDAPDIDPIIKCVQEALSKKDLAIAIDALRVAIEKTSKICDERSAQTSSSDPFRELKLFARRDALRWLKGCLGQLLRLKAQNEQDHGALLEARDILRSLVDEANIPSDRMHLMLALVDLSQNDPSYYPELEEIVDGSNRCAASLYTKALMLFRLHGSTGESRAAMREALDFNMEVPLVMVSGGDYSQVPNHFTFGSREEAEGYCLEARHQWESTPSALEFIVETMARALPAGMRNSVNRVAPPVAIS